MEWLTVLFGNVKERSSFAKAMEDKTSDDYQREALVKQGREQFQKLMDKGLNVPVALL
ncbi:MAG: hypothetical protein H0W89_05420 [Candidatus Levybacteria bacterium]|nr:hypothetical protein [Candidatus Levybacteria bacterium]